MTAPTTTRLGHEPDPAQPVNTATFVGPGGVTRTTQQAVCKHCQQWVPIGAGAPAYRCWARPAAA